MLNILKCIIVIFCIVAWFAEAENEEKAWQNFKVKHAKKYKSKAVEAVRKKNFLAAKKKIDAHNELFKSKKTSYELALNEFSDVPVEKLRKLRNGRRPGRSNFKKLQALSIKRNRFDNVTLTAAMLKALPKTVNWVKRGKVTRIKNQGYCGCCYAFSTAAAIESRVLMKHKKRVNLSPQQSVDCSGPFGNLGCDGGLEKDVFRYLIHAGGIETLGAYPYRGNKGPCRFKKSLVHTKLRSYRHFIGISEDRLKYLVAKKGPVTVGMDAALESFTYYKSGVYNDTKCKSGYYDLDHSVLCVGYGTTKEGIPYWRIRNSWGKSWGMNGYYLIARKGNLCGIRTDVNYPIIV